MAISKDKKQSLVADLTTLLNDSKTTVFARYQGLTVADMQALRAAARAAGVKIKVVKNRLVKVAMNEIAVYKDTDTTGLTGQLLYAISSEDEVAPAKVLAEFAKTHKALEIAGGFSNLGANLGEDEVKHLLHFHLRTNLSLKWSHNCFHQSPILFRVSTDFQKLFPLSKLEQNNNL